MEAKQKTADSVQRKIDKFGALCAACLGWGAKQPRNAQEEKCALTGFLNCHRLALQLYLMSERVIPGVVLCEGHEGFAEHIAPALKQYGASISWISAGSEWLIRHELFGEQTAPTTSDMSYARGCVGVGVGCAQKSPEGSVHWVCTSGDLEIVLWKPRSAEPLQHKNLPGQSGTKNKKTVVDEIPVYFEILYAFRAALAPLGLDVHIRVG